VLGKFAHSFGHAPLVIVVEHHCRVLSRIRQPCLNLLALSCLFPLHHHLVLIQRSHDIEVYHWSTLNAPTQEVLNGQDHPLQTLSKSNNDSIGRSVWEEAMMIDVKLWTLILVCSRRACPSPKTFQNRKTWQSLSSQNFEKGFEGLQSHGWRQHT
jgi:hypothetical protein